MGLHQRGISTMTSRSSNNETQHQRESSPIHKVELGDRGRRGDPVTEKLYARRDPMALEPHFTRHMLAMTAEGLDEKGDIALELAWRDAQIERLAARLNEFKEWAESMCHSECGLLLARYGRHAPNCPVRDLGIDQEGGR